MRAAPRDSSEGDAAKILAQARFYSQLEPEYALRHELHELAKSGAITFAFILEEATDFIPRGDGSLLEDQPCQHYLQQVLPSSACSFPQSPDRVGCSSR